MVNPSDEKALLEIKQAYRKLLGLTSLIGAISLFAAGCSGVASVADAIKPWTVTTTGYLLQTSPIPDAITSGYLVYPADKGYAWLAVKLDVKNNLHSNASFDWTNLSVTLIGTDGNKRDAQLTLQSPVGALPQSYEPQEEQSGDVYFEVPTSWSASQVKSSQIVFDYSPLTGGADETITLSMKSVPVMTNL